MARCKALLAVVSEAVAGATAVAAAMEKGILYGGTCTHTEDPCHRERLLRGDLTDIPKERVGCCCRDRERLALDEDAEAGIKEIGITVQVGEVELLAHHLYVPRGPDL